MKQSASQAVRVLDPPPNPGAIRSVYVHAPFCARRCFYCDFAVRVATADCDGWLGALTAEIRALEREGAFVLDDTLDTLYVGGGTPSLLGAQAMQGLLTVIGEERLRRPELEWTAEANPESFKQEVAKGWRSTAATDAKGLAGHGPPHPRNGGGSRRVIATDAVSRYF